MKELKTKRIYEQPSNDDGIRILVDRLWPRGVSKDEAHLDYWYKEIAPSNDLRKWFNHDAGKFDEFKRKYIDELKPHQDILNSIKDMLKKDNVTLLYGAHDTVHNQAIVLKQIIET